MIAARKLDKKSKKNNFVLNFKKSKKNKKMIKPINTLIVLDLSPVIKTATRLNIKNKIVIIKVEFLFLEFINIYPITTKINPFMKAPAIGSSLKKLTIRYP